MCLTFFLYKIFVYSDDINLLAENINTMEQQRSPFTSANTGLEVNTDKIRYTVW